MSFVRLQLGPSEALLATVTKKHVRLDLAPAVVRALGWSDDEPNLSVALGTDDDAGWLKIVLDDEGSTPEGDDGHLHLLLPRSALPDLSPCRSSPLTWRSVDGGIDVRLPTVAPVVGKPSLRSVPKRDPSAPDNIEDVEDNRPLVIGPPPLYAQLHRDAWAAGIEVHFLSNGDCVVQGKVVDVDEIERAVRRAGERRTADVSRAASAA